MVIVVCRCGREAINDGVAQRPFPQGYRWETTKNRIDVDAVLLENAPEAEP